MDPNESTAKAHSFSSQKAFQNLDLDFDPLILQSLVYTLIQNLTTYFSTLFVYSHLSTKTSQILVSISSFFETLVNLKFDYFIFDTTNPQRG